jgi:hypothetical protein
VVRVARCGGGGRINSKDYVKVISNVNIASITSTVGLGGSTASNGVGKGGNTTIKINNLRLHIILGGGGGGGGNEKGTIEVLRC